jgi:hypothetical protein
VNGAEIRQFPVAERLGVCFYLKMKAEPASEEACFLKKILDN